MALFLVATGITFIALMIASRPDKKDQNRPIQK